MRYILSSAIIVAALSLSPLKAHAQNNDEGDDNWDFTLSAGVLASPTYFGDDETEILIVPNFQIEYRDVLEASITGIEYALIANETFRAGPILAYDFGRDEAGSSPFGVSGGNTTDLVGLSDIDGTLEFGFFAEQTFDSFTASIEILQGLGGHEGLRGEVELKYNTALDLLGLGVDAYMFIGPSISYGNDDYNSAFFDISSTQSIASGLSSYDASGGFNSIGLEFTLIQPISRTMSVVLISKYENLIGDVAESSIVKERGSENQLTAGLFLNYHF